MLTDVPDIALIEWRDSLMTSEKIASTFILETGTGPGSLVSLLAASLVAQLLAQ